MPISALGLMEMTRQRSDESIRETALVNCPYCHGRGKVKSALTMSVEIQRRIVSAMRRLRQQGRPPELRITVNPVILERLRKEDEAALVDLESKLGGRLAFVADAGLHLEDFTIQHTPTGEELYTTREA